MPATVDFLEERFDTMLARLNESYDGIGHSSGRPYLYFVYPPTKDQYIRRLADDRMHAGQSLHYIHIDLIRLTVESLAGQEERRTELLNEPVRGANAGISIVRLWARRLAQEITASLSQIEPTSRPVVVLRGVAALHPLGNPSSLMESVAENEPRNPHTERTVPIVLLVPGTHAPQASRTYYFLGLPQSRLSFYRGEEM
ncbi:MAG: hypothetical protein H3C34_23615 [Caldilineaceae bacterium]|nr:hypothetical protein [Caldilineaceae bacterium]